MSLVLRTPWLLPVRNGPSHCSCDSHGITIMMLFLSWLLLERSLLLLLLLQLLLLLLQQVQMLQQP